MNKLSLEAVSREQLASAANSAAHRSSTTVFGGHEHALRQTVIALKSGAVLSEHENPGDATVQVLSGRVRLRAGGDAWDGRTGDLVIVPPQRHSLEALADSVVLLTAVPRAHIG